MAKTPPTNEVAAVPMQIVGPVKITGPEVQDEIMLPLATYEPPLWPSVNRGARMTMLSGGVAVVITGERMARSVVFEAPDAEAAWRAETTLRGHMDDLAATAAGTSRFARLIDLHTQIVGRLLYLRFEFTTGDAAGHNMVTHACDRLMQWIPTLCPQLTYGSVSANYCSDKKVSGVNGILGRGKYAIAETVIPRRIVERFLHTTPEKIATLNVRKNLIGSTLAGGVRTANAHYANMLLAFYLATGQDAANIIEGSQGITLAEAREDGLYFAVTLPNLVVGTVGNGKGLAFVQNNLKRLGCLEPREPGRNARRLAAIAAATVWCGELSLMAALTNPGELMRAHLALERS